jgi:hypothetical protein
MLWFCSNQYVRLYIFGLRPDHGPPVQLGVTTTSNAITPSGGSRGVLTLPR